MKIIALESLIWVVKLAFWTWWYFWAFPNQISSLKHHFWIVQQLFSRGNFFKKVVVWTRLKIQSQNYWDFESLTYPWPSEGCNFWIRCQIKIWDYRFFRLDLYLFLLNKNPRVSNPLIFLGKIRSEAAGTFLALFC